MATVESFKKLETTKSSWGNHAGIYKQILGWSRGQKSGKSNVGTRPCKGGWVKTCQ